MGVKRVSPELIGRRAGEVFEGVYTPLNEDVLASWDFFAARRKSSLLTPTQKLFFEVINDGIHQYLKGDQEAAAWVVAREKDYIFGFDFLCELFGVDANLLASALQAREVYRPRGIKRLNYRGGIRTKPVPGRFRK
jgi:hypothetical protein